MKTIELTNDQMQVIYDELDTIEEGKSFDRDVEIEIGNGWTVVVNMTGSLNVDGYFENDYGGTGAWIETGRDASVALMARLFDENDREVECRLHEKHEKNADRYFNMY